MSIFDRIGRKKKNEINPLDVKMKELAEKAVEYAKQFNYDFDYRRESVDELETILDSYEQAIKKASASDNEVWDLSLVFGAYLGEVLLDTGLRRGGFKWVERDNVPLLEKNDGKTNVSPATKVFKRLKNGSEDNINPFFDIALCIAKKR